jgi:O-antigen ligase
VFQGKAWVAHSIYFQALGEHGFPGLFLFLALGLWIWWVAAGVARKAAQRPDLATWMPLLMRMCQTSLVGFAVGGAFLSLMNLDVPYYLLVIVSLCRLILENKDEPTPVAAGPMRAAVNRPSAAG